MANKRLKRNISEEINSNVSFEFCLDIIEGRDD